MWEDNLGYVGHDLRYFVGLETLEECVEKCNDKTWKRRGCNAVQWNKDKYKCFLKKIPEGVQPTMDANYKIYNICPPQPPAKCGEWQEGKTITGENILPDKRETEVPDR